MLDFHDHAAGIDYPFVTGPSLRVGSYALPTDVIIDAGVVIYGEYVDIPLHSIRRNADGFVISFDTPGDRLTFSGFGVGSFRASASSSSGFLVLGPGFPEFIAKLAVGNDYPARNVVLEPGRVQALDGYCVTSVNLYNGETPAARGITGDVTFSPGYNARIGVLSEDNAVIFVSDLRAGAGLPCYPEELEADPCAGFVRSINGATADANGNIQLDGGPRVEVNEFPDDHKIVVDFTKAFVEGSCEV